MLKTQTVRDGKREKVRRSERGREQRCDTSGHLIGQRETLDAATGNAVGLKHTHEEREAASRKGNGPPSEADANLSIKIVID